MQQKQPVEVEAIFMVVEGEDGGLRSVGGGDENRLTVLK